MPAPLERVPGIKVSVVRPTGVPDTGLSRSIVNPRAIVGILGHHAAEARSKMAQLGSGALAPEHADPDQIGYFALQPRHIAEAILFVIDQPWGASISDIIVRASGEASVI